MKTKPHILEVDIALACVKHLQAQGLTVRTEVAVTLPDHGQVFADIVACKTDETGEWFTVVECKRRLDRDLIEQCLRWDGFAQFVVASYETPKARQTSTIRREQMLDHRGVVRWSVSGEQIYKHSNVCVMRTADTRLLSAAFHSHEGTHDAEAGSSTAHRMNSDRQTLVDLASFCQQGATIKQVNQIPKWHNLTAHKLRGLIDANRDWNKLPLDYSGTGITSFHATNKETK